MNDCFALLHQARRPWLEPEALKQQFIALSTEVHPDRVHNAGPAEREEAQRRYTELNAAYQRLREPKERLQHLLELELGSKPSPVQAVPADLMDLFMEAARLCRETDEFLAETARVTSPLLRVQRFARAQAWTEKLMGLQKRINGGYKTLLDELKRLDAAWCAPANAPVRQALLQQCDELCRRFSFFSRWGAQVQERIVQLSF